MDAGGMRPDQAASRPRLEYALSPLGLHEAAHRCFHGTDWKASVAAFEMNCWKRCLSLSKDLNGGTYKPRRPKRFLITRPKVRECCSIGIRDRVYQRSLNDNVVYPAMSASWIKENCACQKGKGTDYARNLLERQLQRWWHGHGTDGYALCMDVAGYYPNMPHALPLSEFRKHLTDDEYVRVKAILESQYAGEVGFEPGSQLVQIAGISALSPLDHRIKERFRCKFYLRYMDDMIALCATKVEAERLCDEVEAWLSRWGMHLNRRKTRIQKLRYRIPFLGFTFELRPTGKVVRRVKPDKARDQRRRLHRMAMSERAGRIPSGTAADNAGSVYRYLLRNCTDRAGPEKFRGYCKDELRGLDDGVQTGRRPESAQGFGERGSEGGAQRAHA